MAENKDGLTITNAPVTFDNTGGTPLVFPEQVRGGLANYTTTERNAIDGRILDNNMIIYNTTDNQYERYTGGTRDSSGFMSGGSWALLELGAGGDDNDDITGDITVSNDVATISDDAVTYPKIDVSGNAGDVLVVNADGDDWEWVHQDAAAGSLILDEQNRHDFTARSSIDEDSDTSQVQTFQSDPDDLTSIKIRHPNSEIYGVGQYMIFFVDVSGDANVYELTFRIDTATLDSSNPLDSYLTYTYGGAIVDFHGSEQAASGADGAPVVIAIADKRDAIFQFNGANGTNGGYQGYVPAPITSDRNKFLQGNGDWEFAIKPYIQGDDYVEGDVAWFEDSDGIHRLYRCNTSFSNAQATPAATHWDELSPQSEDMELLEFMNDTAYLNTEGVFFEDKLYQATAAITPPAEWVILSPSDFYDQGDYVLWQGVVYENITGTNNGFTNPANDSTNWAVSEDLDPDNSSNWQLVGDYFSQVSGDINITDAGVASLQAGSVRYSELDQQTNVAGRVLTSTGTGWEWQQLALVSENNRGAVDTFPVDGDNNVHQHWVYYTVAEGHHGRWAPNVPIFTDNADEIGGEPTSYLPSTGNESDGYSELGINPDDFNLTKHNNNQELRINIRDNAIDYDKIDVSGSAGQILTVNTDGDNWEWADPVDANTENWIHANNGNDFAEAPSATAGNTIAIGDNAEATEYGAIAIGTDNTVSGSEATAIGHQSNAAHDNSASFGRRANTDEDNEIRLGGSIQHITKHPSLAGHEVQDHELVSKAYVDNRIAADHIVHFTGDHANELYTNLDPTAVTNLWLNYNHDANHRGITDEVGAANTKYYGGFFSKTQTIGQADGTNAGFPSTNWTRVFTSDVVGDNTDVNDAAVQAELWRWDGNNGLSISISNRTSIYAYPGWRAGPVAVTDRSFPEVTMRLQLVKLPHDATSLTDRAVVIASSEYEHYQQATTDLAANEEILGDIQHFLIIDPGSETLITGIQNGEYLCWRWEWSYSSSFGEGSDLTAPSFIISNNYYDDVNGTDTAFHMPLNASYPNRNYRFELRQSTGNDDGDLYWHDEGNDNSVKLFDSGDAAIPNAALTDGNVTGASVSDTTLTINRANLSDQTFNVGNITRYSDDDTYTNGDTVWFEDDSGIYVWVGEDDSVAGDSPSDNTTDWGSIGGSGSDGLDQYTAGNTYAINDVVWYATNDKIYVATAAIPSAPAVLSLDNWDELSGLPPLNGGNIPDNHTRVDLALSGENLVAYIQDSHITYDDFGGADGTNGGSAGLVPAPEATDNGNYLRGDGTWAAISDSTGYYTGPFDEDTSYAQHEVIEFQGELFRWTSATNSVAGTSPIDTGESWVWLGGVPNLNTSTLTAGQTRVTLTQEQAAGDMSAYITNSDLPLNVPDYDAADDYVSGDVVVFDGALYRATSAVTAPATWAAATDYSSDDYVIYNGTVYKALNDITGAASNDNPATDTTNWEVSDDLDPDNSSSWEALSGIDVFDYIDENFTGDPADASGTNSIAMGAESTASGLNSIAIGSIRDFGIPAFNEEVEATGENSIAIGVGTKATNNITTAIGSEAKARGPRTVAIGQNAVSGDNSDPTEGDGAVAIGNAAAASADGATAIGDRTEAEYLQSTAIGFNTTTTADCQTMLGEDNVAVTVGVAGLGGILYRDATANTIWSQTGIQQDGNMVYVADAASSIDDFDMARHNFEQFGRLAAGNVVSTDIAETSYYTDAQSDIAGASVGDVSRLIKSYTFAGSLASSNGYVIKTFHYDTDGNLETTYLTWISGDLDRDQRNSIFGSSGNTDVWALSDDNPRHPVGEFFGSGGSYLLNRWTGFNKDDAAVTLGTDGNVRLLGQQLFIYDDDNNLTNKRIYARRLSGV